MEPTSTTRMDTVVVGGGLTGLTAAALLARAGRSVTLFEKTSDLGGRAITTERHGFFFNRGVHALYLTGPGETILRELGVSYSGKPSDRSVYEGQHAGILDRLPNSAASIATTRLLNPAARAEIAALLMNLRQIDAADWHGTSMQAWLEQATTQPVIRRFIEAAVRLATYTHAPELLDAGFALRLVGTQPKALLLDGGWQTLVDGLNHAARSAGARLVSSARVMAVDLGDETHTVRLADGTTVQTEAVVLATEPAVAAQVVADGRHAALRHWAAQTLPLYVACLDVGLRHLPDPDRLVVLDFDRPLYYSVHSRSSRLAPPDGALIHTIKYLRPDEKGDTRAHRRELEEWLDRLQPGWRDVVVAQQFLPHIQVSSDMIQARRGGPAGRPGPAVPDVRNLFVVGDWVGQQDHLANAGFASAQQAAQMILASAPARR
jgi:phytoene dehydrogenase-like protein